MPHIKYLILGAGPTGLGAAYRLKELGQDDFLILEQQPYAGGLATTFTDDKGFLWDIGGHVQFSHYAYFDQLMQKALGREGWLFHQRESWVWLLDRFVPYPFQNNLRYLPKEQQLACLQGLISLLQNPTNHKPQNFAEWATQSFGEGLCEVFMRPYNFKVWAFPLQEMAYNWIGERVATVDVSRLLKNIYLEQDDLSWGPNNTFQFPKNGGTGAIWNAVADMVGRDRIRLNSRVLGISAQEKTVTLADGQVFSYDYLLSTLPVDILTQIISDCSENIRQTAQNLKHSSTNIVGIGLKGKPKAELASKCWLYFPESDCPFYRTTVFSNYSPNNVPDIEQYWSLMTETSESAHKPVDTQTIVEDTIQGLLNTKLISSREEIVSTWSFRAEYGYPTPSVERDSILQQVIPYLQSKDIYSRGRFGGWKYEVSNQDHSLMQGVEWANKMLLQIPETTYFFPNTANANWGK